MTRLEQALLAIRKQLEEAMEKDIPFALKIENPREKSIWLQFDAIKTTDGNWSCVAKGSKESLLAGTEASISCPETEVVDKMMQLITELLTHSEQLSKKTKN